MSEIRRNNGQLLSPLDTYTNHDIEDIMAGAGDMSFEEA